MKVCVAQTRSLKGSIRENMLNHLGFIEQAIGLDADLIIFPELSITNYEPSLARELAIGNGAEPFRSIQELSNSGNISVGMGMPTIEKGEVFISMLIYQPHEMRKVYSKQLLHDDEQPYFTSGKEQVYLFVNDIKVAVGICYETLQREHFENAWGRDFDVYVASVAKSQNGIKKAHEHFSKISGEFKTPILMSNSIGPSDDFTAAGQSAVWNENGMLLEQLDDRSEGILWFDTRSSQTGVEMRN